MHGSLLFQRQKFGPARLLVEGQKTSDISQAVTRLEEVRAERESTETALAVSLFHGRSSQSAHGVGTTAIVIIANNFGSDRTQRLRRAVSINS